MEITFLHHSCFKLRGKLGTVVTDPYRKTMMGFAPPAVSADIITVSHQHDDHNGTEGIHGTTRRPEPFIISQPGEYEVGGISVFGYPSFHDSQKGAERGNNTIFKILIDEISICHLGDLGHTLDAATIEEIGQVDVLLCPVGGEFTINPKQAVEVIQKFEPSYVIPMHFQTPNHPDHFAKLAQLADFLKEYGSAPVPQPKLVAERSKLPEETELVVLAAQLKGGE